MQPDNRERVIRRWRSVVVPVGLFHVQERPVCRIVDLVEAPGGISGMDSISGEAAHRLSALWEAKRTGRLMPARADFDVLHDLRPFLGRLILAEVIEGGRDWRYRVFGTTIAALRGEEHHGTRLTELPPEEQQFMSGLFNQVAWSRRPAEVDHPSFRIYPLKRHKLLVFPLSDDGETVNMILALLETAGARQTTIR